MVGINQVGRQVPLPAITVVTTRRSANGHRDVPVHLSRIALTSDTGRCQIAMFPHTPPWRAPLFLEGISRHCDRFPSIMRGLSGHSLGDGRCPIGRGGLASCREARPGGRAPPAVRRAGSSSREGGGLRRARRRSRVGRRRRPRSRGSPPACGIRRARARRGDWRAPSAWRRRRGI